MKKFLIFLCIGFLVICSTAALCFGAEAQSSAEDDTLPITLVVHKIDSGTQLPVEDATFVLSREDGSYLETMSTGGSCTWTKDEAKAYSLTTDGEGMITYYGLMPGIYYLQETVAPEGYILLEEPIQISLSVEYEDGTIASATALIGEEGRTETAEGDLIHITIENTYGTVLPATGGIGMGSYYMFGFVLLFALSLVIVAKRLIREQ